MLAGADSLGEREVKRKVRVEDRLAKYGAVGELCMMLLGQESLRDVILFPQLKPKA